MAYTNKLILLVTPDRLGGAYNGLPDGSADKTDKGQKAAAHSKRPIAALPSWPRVGRVVRRLSGIHPFHPRIRDLIRCQSRQGGDRLGLPAASQVVARGMWPQMTQMSLKETGSMPAGLHVFKSAKSASSAAKAADSSRVDTCQAQKGLRVPGVVAVISSAGYPRRVTAEECRWRRPRRSGARRSGCSRSRRPTHRWRWRRVGCRRFR